MAAGRFVLGSAWVEIKADHSQLSSSSAVRDTEKHGEKHGKAFGGAFAGAATGLIATLGLTALASKLIGFAGDSIAEAREAQKVGADTQAVIDSTGGAANRTRLQIEKLSTSISNKIGVDDELIQKHANVLLSFKAVNNEIYDRSVPLIEDISARMGNDGVGAAKALGKALTDPVGALGGLSKAGVQFTAQEKEKIKALVDSGKQHEAQALILDKVSQSVGGSAAAQATAGDKAAVAMANLKESIGGLLLPVLDKLGNWFTNTGKPVIEGLINGLKGEGITSGGIVGKFEALGVTLRAIWETGSKAFDWIKDKLEAPMKTAGDVIAGVFNVIQDTFNWLKNHKDLVESVGTAALVVASAITAISIAVKIWTAYQWLLNAALTANPLGIVIVAITAIVAAVIYAYKHFEGFRDVVDNVFSVIKVVVGAWWDFMTVVFDWLKTYAWPVAKKVFEDIYGVISTVFDWLKPKIADWWAYISLLWDWFVTYAWPKIQEVWINIQNVITAVIDFIVPKIQAWWDFLKFVWDWITLTAWPAIEKFWNDLWAKISEVINFILVKYEEFRLGLDILKTRIGEYLDTARNSFQTFKDKVEAIWNGLRDSIAKVWQQVIDTGKAKINELGHLVNQVIKAVNIIPFVHIDFLPEPLLAAEGGAVSGSLGGTGTAVFKKEGGAVFGGRMGIDTVPAVGPGGRAYRLDNGEHILTGNEVRKMGGQGAVYAFRKNLMKFGDGGAIRMAGGGRVDAGNSALLEEHRNHVHVAMDVPNMGFPLIIAKAATSGIPYTVGSTYRPGSRAGNGNLDHHSEGRAVDFPGFNQDRFASWWEQTAGVIELIHRTDTRDYAIFGGKGAAGGGIFSLVSWLLGAAGKAAKAALEAAIGPLEAALPQGDGAAPSSIRGIFQGIPAGARKFFQDMGDRAGGSGGAGSAASGAAQEYARKRLAAYGWGDDQWGALQSLWTGESGWNASAVNSSSGAYGIPQILPSSHGHPVPLGDYSGQIDWGLNYIKGRYGSPSKAYSFWLGNNPHWYSEGGAIGMRQGGVVPGSGFGDKIPIMAEPGEIMVSNDDQRRGALGTTIVYRIDKVEVSARDVKEFKSVIDFFENVVQVAKTGVKG